MHDTLTDVRCFTAILPEILYKWLFGSNKHLHDFFYQGKSAEKKQQHPQLFFGVYSLKN